MNNIKYGILILILIFIYLYYKNNSIKFFIEDNKSFNSINHPVKFFTENNKPISGMMTKHQIYGVIYYLDEIIRNNIEGDIVELGCNIGTTSICIQKWLQLNNNIKKFHVYDSWEGLPDPVDEDENNKARKFVKGDCKTNKEVFIKNFKIRNLKLPIIHSGWFKDIPDSEYPSKICFAFLDGDFYTSIMDSLNKIYHKMVKGGIIIIDDCGWDVLPGCKKAVDDFLNDKPETLELSGYPNEEYQFTGGNHGGKIIKL